MEIYYETHKEELEGRLFLSFEEWRKQHNAIEGPEPSRKPQPLAQTGPKLVKDQNAKTVEVETKLQEIPQKRSNKDRFNYASCDCAAKVLAKNEGFKSPSSVLNEDSDKYAINKCSASEKFIVLELCDNIKVDTVILANYEMFSSTLRHFTVSVSTQYPVREPGWVSLGEFEAKNSREIQSFEVKSPELFVKYLKLNFTSYYGSSQLCPLSLVRILGTTMIDDYKISQDAEQDVLAPLKPGQSEECDDKKEEKVHPVTTVAIKDNEKVAPASSNSTQNKTLPNNSPSSINSSCTQNISSIESFLGDAENTNSNANSTQKKPLTTTQPNPAPTAHSAENVYSTINRRLGLLEANASLSLRYIEEQSKMLMVAFSSLERNHAANTEKFMAKLNSTLNMQLKRWQRDFEQIIHTIQIQEQEITKLSYQIGTVNKELFMYRVILIIHSFFLVAYLFLLASQKLGTSVMLNNVPDKVSKEAALIDNQNEIADPRSRMDTADSNESNTHMHLLRTYSQPQLSELTRLWEQSPSPIQ